MNNNSNDMYLIPENVAERFEFFEGFGFKELIKVLLVAAIGVSIFFISGLIKKTEYTDVNQLSYEMKIGLSESEVNSEGKVVRKVPIIPNAFRIIAFIIIPIIISIFAVIRFPEAGNRTIVDYLKAIKRFKTEQTQFDYKYME